VAYIGHLPVVSLRFFSCTQSETACLVLSCSVPSVGLSLYLVEKSPGIISSKRFRSALRVIMLIYTPTAGELNDQDGSAFVTVKEVVLER
jgi:hypothetical protein